MAKHIVRACCFSFVFLTLGWLFADSFNRCERTWAPPGGLVYPDVIIAGAKKCGTGALIKMLGQHPRVAASSREQHFLNKNFHMGWHFYSDSLLRTSNWEPGKVLMEKTPSYFIDPEVPRRIDLLGAKVVLILCNPVTRTLSDMVMYYLERTSKGTLEEMVQGTLKRKRIGGSGSQNLSALIMSRSNYTMFLERWLTYFKVGKNLFIVDGENLKERPWEEVGRVEKELGLPSYTTKEHFFFNATKGFYCMRAWRSCHRKKGHGDLKGMFPKQFVQKLRTYFAPLEKSVNQLLNTNFSWNFVEQ